MENILEIVKRLAIPIFIILLIIGAVFGVVNFQKNRKAPEVSITEPKEGVTTEAPDLEVTGTTNSPDNTVYVNGNSAEVSEDGSFKYKMTLNEGENPIEVEVFSKGGKSTKTSVIVKRTAATAPGSPSGAPAPNGGGGQTGNQDRGVLGGGAEKSPGAAGGADGSLSTSGPKENAIAILWIFSIFLYYYQKSRKVLAENMKKV